MVKGTPIPAPRQSGRDAFKPRPCVIRYRDWRDTVRAQTPKDLTNEPSRVKVIFYLPFPKTYSQKKRAALRGQPHRLKPDHDNLGKALMDALFDNDQMIWDGHYVKYWDDGNGARAVVMIDR